MRIGAHVGVAGGIQTGVQRGVDLGCTAIQVFAQSPRQWKPQVHAPENLAAFREARAAADMEVVVHAAYLINLAGRDSDMIERSITSLRASCAVAAEIDAIGVVVHVGSHLGDGLDVGLGRIETALRPVLADLDERTWLLLENTAGVGGTIGRTVEELARLTDAVDHPRLGLCLDSCHLWASGLDVGDDEAMDALVADVDARIGLARLKALHLNDSLTPLGSNRDRHGNIGQGLIGRRLSAFLGHPALQGLPALLETSGPDGHGPDRACLAAARRLWRSGVRRRSGRTAGTAPRAARRTRG